MAADGIGAPPPGADRTALNRWLGQQALAILGNLAPGTAFSGRVVGPTPEGLWQVVVRGATLTVASPVPLTPDQVVQFQVLRGGGDGPLQVRLAETPMAAATGSPMAARLQALGLPDTPAAAAVVHAFEDHGAPLHPPRLRHAVAVLEQAQREPFPTSPEDDDAGPAPTPRPTAPPGAEPPAPRAAPAPAGAPVFAPVRSDGRPATVAAAPETTPEDRDPAPLRTPAAGPERSPPPLPPGRAEAAPPRPATAGTPTAATAAAPPTSSATPPPTPATARVPPPTLGADPRLPTVFALLAKADLPVTPATLGVALRAAADRLPDPVTAVQAWRPDTILPDIADDDGPAALRAALTALALAGLRPAARETPAPVATPPGTPPPPAPAESRRADGGDRPLPNSTDDAPEPLLTTVTQTVAREAASPLGAAALRELAADPLLPPRHLDDYDHVQALPLLAQGQAAPARLAVTTRTSPNGTTATWMRVDCDLSRLGPVSLRLSGTEGGPVAITVVATARGAPAIAAGVPDLIADLQARGLPAAVRVVQEDAPW